jgi:hypothetical protein
MKIGDKIWEHRDRRGWLESEIAGENRVSWIIGPSYDSSKVNKKALAAGELRGWKATRAEVDDVVWVTENAWRLGSFIQGVGDAAILRQVAVLIGYVTPSSTK